MKKPALLFILSIFAINIYAQGVIVNPDGTHSVQTGSVIVNPDGTHSVQTGSVIVNSNGTHSTIVGNVIVNPDGANSVKSSSPFDPFSEPEVADVDGQYPLGIISWFFPPKNKATKAEKKDKPANKEVTDSEK